LKNGLATAEEAAGGIAWYAHIGGLVAGYATMLCVRDHTAHELVEERNGRLRMEVAETETDHDETEAELEEAPQVCPHCSTPLNEDCRMADTLWRCGNPDCERLIYLEEVTAVRQRAART
jgi:ribosomal protein L37AE/L43A